MKKYNFIRLFSLVSTLVTSLLSFSQELPQITDTRQINVHKEDSLLKVSVLRNASNELKTDRDKKYYWYAMNQIHCNQGSWSGNLLHGNYKAFDAQNNLVQQGQFEMGLKTGIWLKWDKDGNVSEEMEWKKGYKSGIAKYYEDGNLIKEVDYKDNVRHGKTIIFKHGEEEKVVKYRDGEQIIPKEKKEDWFLKRWIESLKKKKSEENGDSETEEMESVSDEKDL